MLVEKRMPVLVVFVHNTEVLVYAVAQAVLVWRVLRGPRIA